MSKSTKIILGLIIAALVIWGLTNLDADTKQAEGKPIITIGVTLPLTGDIAMLGESTRNAIMLAHAELKNTKYEYKLVFEDDKFKPAEGASTFNKLVFTNKANALISFGSPVGNVVSELAEKAKVPHVNDFASDPNVAKGDFNFLHYTPAYKDAELFIQQLNKRNLKNIVVFTQQDNPGAIALSQALEKQLPGTNIKVLATEKFFNNTRDFKTVIGKMKALNPDAYVLEGNTPGIDIIAKQIRETGIKTLITSMESFEFSDQLSLYEGMWYVNAADPTKAFVDAYQAKYNDLPKFGAANGYDGVNLLVQAIESVGDGKRIPTNLEIRDSLARTKDFDSALGNNLQIDAEGMIISEPVVRIIKNGKPVTIEK